MAAISHPFMGKIYVGRLVTVGKLKDRYTWLLLDDEVVEAEFEGVRDSMIWTNYRMMVSNAQGITGKKVEYSSFAWRAITAFSLENAGAVDIDAELKICGSGWGVCEVQLARGTPLQDMARYLGKRILRGV